jgi:hypothetical protein
MWRYSISRYGNVRVNIQNIPKDNTCSSQDNSADTLDLAEKIPEPRVQNPYWEYSGLYPEKSANKI